MDITVTSVVIAAKSGETKQVMTKEEILEHHYTMYCGARIISDGKRLIPEYVVYDSMQAFSDQENEALRKEAGELTALRHRCLVLEAELSRIKGEYDALKQSMTSLGVLTGDDARRFQERHDANMKRLDKKDIELPKIDLDDYTIKSI